MSGAASGKRWATLSFVAATMASSTIKGAVGKNAFVNPAPRTYTCDKPTPRDASIRGSKARRAYQRLAGEERKAMLIAMAHALRITIDVPAPLAGQPAAALADRARLLLVIDEVRSGRLTRPGAARALGIPLDDFLIEAGRHGLYAIDYDVDDFRRELDRMTTAGS
jgi:hypothetical protein